MKPIAALALFSFFSPSASADVNMLDASFRQTFIDAKVGGLNIERRYDSRSTFLGLFGFGWCSTFDTHLVKGKVIECGKPSTTTARYENGVYTQTLPTGLQRTFDADTGELVALRAPKGPQVTIAGGLRSRLPRAAALGEGLKMRLGTMPLTLRLEFDPLREHVTALTLPDGTRLSFTYSDQRDLLEARNAWKNTYDFEYDKLHNLTRVKFPDATDEQLVYDTDRDRLTHYKGRDGCIEAYEHTTSLSRNERTQVSTAKLSCDGAPKRQAVFRFGFLRKAQGWVLHSFAKGNQ